MVILWILLIAGAAVVATFVVYGIPQVIRWFQVRRWDRCTSCIALTYDDGPDRQTTPELLNVLDEKGVKATFYLVGFRAEQCPAEMERLRASGHELGAHSYNHLHAWKVPPWTEFADAHKGYRSLGSPIAPTGPFRPPFGKVTFPTMLSMWLKRRPVQWWSIATNDTAERLDDAESTAERVLNAGKTVILMHCHHDEPERRRFVLALTKALIDKGRGRGLSFVTMKGLMSAVAGPSGAGP